MAAAVADAGLTPADIDGAVTFAMDVNDELSVIRCAGIPELRFTARTRGGGGGACATVQLASAAVASGAADAVVVYRAFNERSGRRFGQPIAENNQARVTPPGWNWYLPFGLDTPAKVYALWYQRYMHKYGVTNVDFGRYPVVARKHAATNPNAFYYQQPLTLEDHQAVALDRRTDPAQARLLPGERRRRRHGRHEHGARAATSRTPPVRVAAATPGAPARRRGDVRLLRRRPRRPSRRRRRSGVSSTRRPASRPTTSTWR